jgi:sec-independent protein translocase protein TatA
MNTHLLPLALGMPGGPELFLILLLVLIFFGAKRLPEMARSLGSGIKEFKKAMREVENEVQNATNDTTTTPPSKPAAPASADQKPAPPASAPPGNN